MFVIPDNAMVDVRITYETIDGEIIALELLQIDRKGILHQRAKFTVKQVILVLKDKVHSTVYCANEAVLPEQLRCPLFTTLDSMKQKKADTSAKTLVISQTM